MSQIKKMMKSKSTIFKLILLLLLIVPVGTISAQHKLGVQPVLLTKYNVTDKFFFNQYFEYCHDFTNNQMNYFIIKPLGVGYKFNDWFTMDFGFYYFQFQDSGMHRPELSFIFTHRENNFQFQYQKRITMDKNTTSDYHDWYHRSHFTVSYDIPNTRFTPVATFEFYLKNGLKQSRLHGGTNIRLTDHSSLSLQIFHIVVPSNQYQEYYLFGAYILTI